MGTRQITSSVHMICIPFTIPHPEGVQITRHVNVFIIDNGRQVTFIDTGVSGSEQILYGYLRSIGRSPASIALVVHTHAHPDHIGATRAIHEDTGCYVAIHPHERAWLEDVGLQARERPVPGFGMLVGGSVPVDRVVQEGDRISLGSHLHLRVLDTPGHSKGSVSLYLEEEGVLFTGDLIPRPDDLLIYENPLETIRSLEKIQSLPDLRILLSSWDEPYMDRRVYEALKKGAGYIHALHRLVWDLKHKHPSADTTVLGRLVLDACGLSSVPVNPLIANTIAGHLLIETLPEFNPDLG
jgi:hydroxyacylglutathione hydrolase